MIYEIINPSDPYTIEAERYDIAFISVLHLGTGAYGLEPTSEGKPSPLLAFSNEETIISCVQKVLGMSSSDFIDQHREDIANCLDSVVIGSVRDREDYYTALKLITDTDKRKEWQDQWLNKRRSSLNNIAKRAYGMAKDIREQKNPS